MNTKTRKFEKLYALPQLTILTVIGCFCLLFATTVFGQQNEITGGTYPTLTGEKAIEYLKQNGEYEQFAATFKSIQSKEIEPTSELIQRRFVQYSKTIPPSSDNAPSFGASIAVSGNTMIVGSWGGIYFEGAVYIFVRNGRDWVQQARLTPNGGAIGDYYGMKVAISGDTAFVSAEKATVSVQGQGVVYVYTRSGTTWTQRERIVNNTPIQNERYGTVLDVDGNTLIIGSPLTTAGGVTQVGKINVYQKNGLVWDLTTSIFPVNYTPNLKFGSFVKVKGDTMVVGAGGGTEYIYRKINNVWNFNLVTTYPSGEYYGLADVDINDKFIVIVSNRTLKTLKRTNISWEEQPITPIQYGAVSISLNKNLLAIGNTFEGNSSNEGVVYIYARIGEQWVFRQRFAPTDISNFNFFGAELHFESNYLVSGSASTNAVYTFVLSPGTSDFDGDGADDISVFRSGNWYINNSSNGFSAVQFGAPTDKLAPGDFNGDGITDVSVFRNGFWYRIRSSDNVFVQNQFGAATDIPVSGDFNGNGTSDVAVFRPSNGTWYWLLPTLQAGSATFGAATDKPVPADFDGDGITDVAVFRPSNGNWYWLNSSNGQFRAVAFGQNGDVPVTGDFDGDGRADQAVFRPSNGVWYLLGSTTGFSSLQWGISTDTPVPADYDGDGKTDVAIFRNGLWVILRSSGGVTQQQFGAAGDKPVPAAFIQ